MQLFKFGIGLGNFTEDNSSGTGFAVNTIDYLKQVGKHFDSIWVPDHLNHFISNKPSDVLECMTTISYMSAQFPDHRFGTAVLCNNFRNPALTAKMSATLDSLTGGRFILGIGGGWYRAEYEQYGYEYLSSGVRIRQLEEAAQIIKGLWAQEHFSFQGKYYSVKDASFYPKPKNPILMIGGGGEGLTLKVVVRYADVWNAALIPPEDFRRKVSVLRRCCVKADRDFDEIERTLLGILSIGDSDSEARRLASISDYRDYPLVAGSPKSVTGRLNEYVKAGVDGFIFCVVPFPDIRGSLLLAEEVMPQLDIPQ